MPTTWRSGKRLARVSSAATVGRVVEGRDQHQAVGDVEVGVAGRQPLAFEDDRAGHGQLDDAERLSVLVAGRLQPPEVVLERLVVGVVVAGLDDRDDGSRIDEPRQVVDVAVGVVAVDPSAEPDDVVDAEVVGEDLFQGRAVQAGVARLDFSLSRHSSVVRSVPRPLTSIAPPSITTRPRPPFLLDPRHPAPETQPSRQLAREAVVVAVVVVLGPAVELPVDQADAVGNVGRRLVLDDERRARVAEPDPVGRRLEERTDSRSTPAASSWSATRRFIARSRTTMWTSSTRLRWRTISV